MSQQVSLVINKLTRNEISYRYGFSDSGLSFPSVIDWGNFSRGSMARIIDRVLLPRRLLPKNPDMQKEVLPTIDEINNGKIL